MGSSYLLMMRDTGVDMSRESAWALALASATRQHVSVKQLSLITLLTEVLQQSISGETTGNQIVQSGSCAGLLCLAALFLLGLLSKINCGRPPPPPPRHHREVDEALRLVR